LEPGKPQALAAAVVQLQDEIPFNFVPDLLLGPVIKSGFGFLSKTAALLWYSG